jgi:monothiol glutaredoxin
MSDDAIDTIRRTVAQNDVVLFMKGTADQPQCGFSNQVVRILDHVGVEYVDVNVLADDDIRQGVKDFSDWPTIPQLYVKGEFIGGCDIVREMFQTGELKTLFADKGVGVTA